MRCLPFAAWNCVALNRVAIEFFVISFSCASLYVSLYLLLSRVDLVAFDSIAIRNRMMFDVSELQMCVIVPI